MANISGRLIFDRNRTASATSSMAGIADVSIVLQNTTTGETLAVTTGANGNYSFTNVQNGSYQIVEAYGYLPAVATLGDFGDATIQELLTSGTTPPISYATNPPEGATHLDCTIKNLRKVSVSGSNLTDQNFLNGPVTYTPITTIMDDAVIVSLDNLVENADEGTFGQYDAGINANTGASPLPYTNLGTDFAYVLPNPSSVTPNDGQFTIQNIMNNSHSNNVGTWWIVADHSKGNETGRMMVINGYKPGAVIFKEEIVVNPQTYYLFSAWILNLCKRTGYANPALGVTIFNEEGEVMYEATLGELIQIKTTNPEWKQIGTVFHSGNSNILTLQFVSMGPAATGNDYVIDDISLNEVILPVYTPQKEVDKAVVNVGEIVNYTITLENLGKEPLTDVVFQDLLPDSMVFVSESVYVNGINEPSKDPNIGFSVPDIEGGSTINITFSAIAVYAQDVDVASNKAKLTYCYSPVRGGIPIENIRETNEVSTKILYTDLSITKIANVEQAIIGDEVIYTVKVFNNGPCEAENVAIEDIIPNTLADVVFSVDEGLNWSTWQGVYNVETLGVEESIQILIKGVIVSATEGAIANTATVNAITFDTDLSNNESTATIAVTDTADLMIEKTANPNPAVIGYYLDYGIKVTNLGPLEAQNVIIEDEVSALIIDVQYTIDNVTWLPWEGSYTVGTLEADEVFELFIRGILRQTSELTLVNTATVKSTTPDPNMENNTSTVTSNIISPMDDSLADIRVTKTASKNPCNVGEEQIYTIEVINEGPDEAYNVILIDEVQGDILNPEYSIDGLIWQAWTGDYQIGTLANEASITIFIRGIINPNAVGSITNTALAGSDITPDPDISNNISTSVTEVNDQADLTVTKTANAYVVTAGDKAEYTITVLNKGPSCAKDIIISDIIPNGLYGAEYSLNDGMAWTEWKGFYVLDSLDKDDSFNLLIRADVGSDAFGTIENVVTVQSSTPDPNPDDNLDKVDISATASADLSIVKVAQTDTAVSGKQIVYTLKVANEGPSDAKNVVVYDSIASIMENAEYSEDGGFTWKAWGGSCTIDEMKNGESVYIIIRADLKEEAKGTLTNSASVTSNVPDPNPNNNNSTINTPIVEDECRFADLSIIKTACPMKATICGPLTYTLIVHNLGTITAEDVVLVDRIPCYINNPKASLDNGQTWFKWEDSLKLGDMEAGSYKIVLIKGCVDKCAKNNIVNTASVYSKTKERNLDNNHFTTTTKLEKHCC